MALDLKKEISLPFKKGGTSSKGASEYPEKTYINLVQVDKKALDLRRTVPIAILAALLVVLFMKFGIFDFYAQLGAKQAELNTEKTHLVALQSQLSDYNDVLEEYQGYQALSLNEGGLSVDALQVINLVDTCVAPVANVATMSLAGNTLSLSLTDVSLDGIGQLVNTLYQQPLVKNVSVSTATTRNADNENVTAAVTITLATPDSK